MKYNYDYRNYKFSHKISYPASLATGFDEHFHTNYEMLVFLKGDVEYHIENRKYRLKPYDLLFIKPGEHHYLSLRSDSYYERLVFRFPHYAIPKVLLPIIGRKQSLYNVKGSVLFDTFMRLDNYAEKYVGEKLQLLFQNALTEILINFNEFDDSLNENIMMVDDNIVDVLTYINENLDKPISVEEICEKFYISKSKLYKSFNDSMQVPIAKYIRSKKLMYAQHLIRSGQNPTTIYKNCGFNDYSTFYRAYTKLFGFSPSKAVLE